MREEDTYWWVNQRERERSLVVFSTPFAARWINPEAPLPYHDHGDKGVRVEGCTGRKRTGYIGPVGTPYRTTVRT